MKTDGFSAEPAFVCLLLSKRRMCSVVFCRTDMDGISDLTGTCLDLYLAVHSGLRVYAAFCSSSQRKSCSGRILDIRNPFSDYRAHACGVSLPVLPSVSQRFLAFEDRFCTSLNHALVPRRLWYASRSFAPSDKASLTGMACDIEQRVCGVTLSFHVRTLYFWLFDQ